MLCNYFTVNNRKIFDMGMHTISYTHSYSHHIYIHTIHKHTYTSSATNLVNCTESNQKTMSSFVISFSNLGKPRVSSCIPLQKKYYHRIFNACARKIYSLFIMCAWGTYQLRLACCNVKHDIITLRMHIIIILCVDELTNKYNIAYSMPNIKQYFHTQATLLLY